MWRTSPYQVQLLKDVAMFNRLYQQNADYFRQLTLYIIAGDEKLEQVREGELKALLDKADYISEMRCVRHPYDTKGVGARKGIEY